MTAVLMLFLSECGVGWRRVKCDGSGVEFFTLPAAPLDASLSCLALSLSQTVAHNLPS